MSRSELSTATTRGKGAAMAALEEGENFITFAHQTRHVLAQLIAWDTLTPMSEMHAILGPPDLVSELFNAASTLSTFSKSALAVTSTILNHCSEKTCHSSRPAQR